MEAIASDDKQCDPGKYQDPDEGYRISFVAEPNSQEPAHLRKTSRTLYPQGWWRCAMGLGKSFSQLQFCCPRTFACE